VLPGSHKSNLIHPAMDAGGGKIEYDSTDPDAADAFGSAVEVFQQPGDVLLFVRTRAYPSLSLRLYVSSGVALVVSSPDLTGRG